MNLAAIIKDLFKLGDKNKAKILARFFKTGKGEYGEGDKFLGIVVPKQRILAKKYIDLKYSDLAFLLKSDFHEYRFTALMILLYRYKRAEKVGDLKEEKKIVDFYLKNLKYINNWDLVDCSVRDILGAWYYDKDRSLLFKLARGKDLWGKRISIISTYYFIRKNDLSDTFKISEILMNDKHDLIHKAVGWMLREAGKMDLDRLRLFLDKYYQKMPRTMLRYAIEKMDYSERAKYMKR